VFRSKVKPTSTSDPKTISNYPAQHYLLEYAIRRRQHARRILTGSRWRTTDVEDALGADRDFEFLVGDLAICVVDKSVDSSTSLGMTSMTCGRTQPCDLPAIDFSLLALKDYKKIMLEKAWQSPTDFHSIAAQVRQQEQRR